MKVLEAFVKINNKMITPLNTEMDIQVEFKTQPFTIYKVFGSFTYKIEKDTYTKISTIFFKTDETWKHNASLLNLDKEGELTPDSAKIDFDNKHITIEFSKTKI